MEELEELEELRFDVAEFLAFSAELEQFFVVWLFLVPLELPLFEAFEGLLFALFEQFLALDALLLFDFSIFNSFLRLCRFSYYSLLSGFYTLPPFQNCVIIFLW